MKQETTCETSPIWFSEQITEKIEKTYSLLSWLKRGNESAELVDCYLIFLENYPFFDQKSLVEDKQIYKIVKESHVPRSEETSASFSK